MEKFNVQDPDITRRIVEENELAFAFLTKTPIVPGHILIFSKRLAADSSALSTDEWFQILNLKDTICRRLRYFLGAVCTLYQRKRET